MNLTKTLHQIKVSELPSLLLNLYISISLQIQLNTICMDVIFMIPLINGEIQISQTVWLQCLAVLLGNGWYELHICVVLVTFSASALYSYGNSRSITSCNYIPYNHEKQPALRRESFQWHGAVVLRGLRIGCWILWSQNEPLGSRGWEGAAYKISWMFGRQNS